MNNFSWRALAFVALLLTGVFVAGCSETSSSGDASPQAAAVPVTPAGPLYSIGDIVKNPASSAGIALLITGYDPAIEMYERAYIYPNSDGSWGYRLDDKTEQASRSMIEKVYTEKIRTVSVSAIPVGTPAMAATTAAAAQTPVTTVATTSTVTTTTTTTALAPRIEGIEPDKGKTGTTVPITNLEGKNFLSGAKVTLKKYGEPVLNTTDVVVTSTLISCKVSIPAGSATGYYDLIVTNPDGQYHQYQNGFLVQQGTETATPTTTTTSSVASGLATITQIQTPLLVTGGTADRKEVTILGTNLTAAAKMKLVGPSTIIGDSSLYICSSSSMATQFFDIPAGTTGTFSVALVDTSDNLITTSSGTLTIQ